METDVRPPKLFGEMPELRMDMRGASQENLDVLGHLRLIFLSLQIYHFDICEAIRLYQSSFTELRMMSHEDRVRYSQFNAARCRIAGRDAAMQIYHMHWSITQSIPNVLRHAKAIRDQVDHKLLRQARRTLVQGVPHLERFRDAVSHHAELHMPSQQKRGNQTMSTNNINGKWIDMTKDGIHIKLEMTDDTRLVVESVLIDVFSAFRRVEIPPK